MEVLRDPNKYSQVKVLSNPLKTITCKHQFTHEDTRKDCKIFPELLDLSCGVWQVAVQSVLIVNKTKRFTNTPLNTIFDIKTNLTSSYKQVEGSAVAVDETLCTFPVLLKKQFDFVFFDPPIKIFFTVNNRPTDTFRIYFFVNELLKTPSTIYEFDVQLRLLFQRML